MSVSRSRLFGNTGNYCMVVVFEAGILLWVYAWTKCIRRHAIEMAYISKWFDQLYLPLVWIYTRENDFFYAINGNNLSVKFQHERKWDFFFLLLLYPSKMICLFLATLIVCLSLSIYRWRDENEAICNEFSFSIG